MGKLQDLTGQVFGKLTVLKRVAWGNPDVVHYLCKCSCQEGKELIVSGCHLKTGHTKTCGCGNKDTGLKCTKHIVGQTFNRLTVIAKTSMRDSSGRVIWLTRCNCGSDKDCFVPGSCLRNGKIKSCGCLQKENLPKGENAYQWDPNKTHEERVIKRNYPEYKVWKRAIKERDDFTCQCCEKRGGQLVSHHLDGYDHHPEKRLDLDNGITLCRECHGLFHKKYRSGNNTREQFVNFWVDFLIFTTKSV